jgi:hypothetical protein
MTTSEGPEPKDKWYFKKRTLISAILVLGPFALPLLWAHPRYSLLAKVLWTIGIVVLTYLLGLLTHYLIQYTLELYGLK